MKPCFFSPQNWKTNVRILVGIMSLFCFTFLFPGVAAALQTAFIRANDGHLYEVTYNKPLSVENFSIRLNGEILRGDTAAERDTIADLYIAASILNILPFEVYNHEPGLKEIYEDTANKRRMQKLGELIVGKTIEGAIGVLSGGATLSVSAAALTQDIVITASGAVMEELLLIKAYMVSGTFARMAWVHQHPFANLWASVDGGTEIRIDDIKSTFIQFLKGAQYEQRVVRVMNEYLLLPDRGERAKEFFLNIIPFINAGRFMHSTTLKVEDVTELERMLAASEREINSKVSTRADAIFGVAAKTEAIGKLQQAGRFPNQAPLVIRSFHHQTLAIGGPSVSLDAAEYFRDPEEHLLTYAAWSDDSAVARVERDGSKITIIPNRLGKTHVIVRVVDSGDRSVLQRIFVTVVREHLPETGSPDLVVESISVNKITLAPGERFRLDTVIQNQGDAASQRTTLRFYRSSDPDISPNDTQLHEQTVYRINVGRQITPWKRFTAPDVPGVYYYGVCVDRAGNEPVIGNNCSEAIKVTVPQPTLPDLVIESISASKTTVMSGERFTLSATVRNIGTARSQSGTLRYYGNLGAVGNRNIRRLVPDQTSAMSVQLEAPEEPGVYYYDACISKVRDEVNKDNNCSTRIVITVGAPAAANQVPIASGTIPTRKLTVAGSSMVMDVSRNFRDPDNDGLTYTVRSDSVRVVMVNVSGSQVTLTPQGVGVATVTVIASDGVLTAAQRFSVSVTAAPIVNRPPVNVRRIPDQTLAANGATVHLNLSTYFSDADGDTLKYIITSDNTNVGFLQVVGASVSIFPLSTVGRANVRVTASDGDLTATQDFTVIVQRTQPINRPPAAIGTIAPQTMTVNGTAGRGNIAKYFRDPDGNNLTYTARSDNTNVVRTSMSKADLTLTPVRAGSATVTVTASDGSLTATQSISVTVASVLPVADPTAFDLAIQSVTVSKDILVPGESFTLSITIHNNGPGTSGVASLSYYYSFIQGRTPEDQIHREGTVKVASLASGANTTKSFRLNAPSTPKTYYYGAWLSGITDDTNLYNDVATEVGVNVQSPKQGQNQNPVVDSAIPDLVIESIRVSDDTLTPNESFKFYATVRNQGAGEASRTTLRYYRSSDATISTSDTRVDTDSVISLDPNESDEEWDNLRAPRDPGTYYYGVCVDSVRGESNTTNNCSRGIRIRVEASSPDLVTESVRVSDATVEVGERFTLYATVRNQGNGEARRTTLRYYRSSDSNISARDTEEDTDSVSSLDADETSEERVTITAPNRSGTYYYGVCVDDVRDESNTTNNCSRGIRVTVADAIIVRPRGLSRGDSIVVQNSKGGGLNGLIVRSGAGTGFKHIISVFDGATGTITDGPESANGYTWWKVRWDRSDQVFCDVNPCVGWAIEFFRGTRVIAEDDALAAPALHVVIPTETILLSNYPNPFNPETWIPYQLSASADVSVSIYSVNGHLVRRLDLGHQSAGVYQSRSRAAYWDGRNAFGEHVASGLYFYTLTAGEFTATRKMLIRK